jgi:hypothetical protein
MEEILEEVEHIGRKLETSVSTPRKMQGEPTNKGVDLDIGETLERKMDLVLKEYYG